MKKILEAPTKWNRGAIFGNQLTLRFMIGFGISKILVSKYRWVVSPDFWTSNFWPNDHFIVCVIKPKSPSLFRSTHTIWFPCLVVFLKMCKTLVSFSLIFVFSCRKFKKPEGFELGSSESNAKMLTTRPPPCLVVTAPLGVEKVNFWLLWNLALKVAVTRNSNQSPAVWSLASDWDVGKLVLVKHNWARISHG